MIQFIQRNMMPCKKGAIKINDKNLLEQLLVKVKEISSNQKNMDRQKNFFLRNQVNSIDTRLSAVENKLEAVDEKLEVVSFKYDTNRKKMRV